RAAAGRIGAAARLSSPLSSVLKSPQRHPARVSSRGRRDGRQRGEPMADEPTSAGGGDRFPTTDWRFLANVPGRSEPGAQQALGEFLGRYWKPVFYYLRARGYPLHKAEDLTQDFLLRFWSRDLLQKADPRRGKFRTFLLAVLRNFLSDQGPRAPLQHRFEH